MASQDGRSTDATGIRRALKRSTYATELQLQSKQRKSRRTTGKYATGGRSRNKNAVVRLDPSGVDYKLPPAATPGHQNGPPRCRPPLWDQEGTIFLAHGHVPQHTRHQKRRREQSVIDSSPRHSKSIRCLAARVEKPTAKPIQLFCFLTGKAVD